MSRALSTWCCGVLLLCLGPMAQAGSRAGGEPQFSPAVIAVFAKQVERTVAAKGARVFILARLGSPAKELPKGVEYTHTGIGVYSMITTQDGQQVPGYSIINLYQKADRPNRSELVQDFPVDYFAGAYALKTDVLIPTADVQRRLLRLIRSGDYKALHNPAYSILANPYDSRFQNCTEFTLDVLNAAVYGTTDVAQLKANERAYFQAQPISLSPFTLLLGSLFMEDVSLADQDEGIRTATFSTIAAYMEQNGLLQERLQVAAQ